jgi:hypothetical protein
MVKRKILESVVEEFYEEYYTKRGALLSEKEDMQLAEEESKKLTDLGKKVKSDKSVKNMLEHIRKNLQVKIKTLPKVHDAAKLVEAKEEFYKYEGYVIGESSLQEKFRQREWELAEKLAKEYAGDYHEEVGISPEDLKATLLAYVLHTAYEWLLQWTQDLLLRQRRPSLKEFKSRRPKGGYTWEKLPEFWWS